MVAAVFMHLNHEKTVDLRVAAADRGFLHRADARAAVHDDGHHRHAQVALHRRAAGGGRALRCRCGRFTCCSSRCRSSWPRSSPPGRSGSIARARARSTPSTASASLAAGVGLVVYGAAFQRKTQEPVNRAAVTAADGDVSLLLAAPASRWRARCASAQSDSPLASGDATSASSSCSASSSPCCRRFAAFFVYLNRRRAQRGATMRRTAAVGPQEGTAQC